MFRSVPGLLTHEIEKFTPDITPMNPLAETPIKEVTREIPGSKDLLNIKILEYVDKLIVLISYNGEINTTYRVNIPDKNALSNIQGLSINESAEDDAYNEEHGLQKDLLDKTANLAPVCLLGDSSNLKLKIFASQLMALILTLDKTETRDLIISASSKLFHGKNVNDTDFDNLIFVMDTFKSCYVPSI